MIVVDVETTGTDPDRHSIVSIGAIEFEHPERQFYRECRAWDGAQVEEEALAVNGFSLTHITDPALPSLEKAIAEFIAWCKDAGERTLGGHNTSFDRDFLQASADRYNLAWHFGHRILDLHSFAWMHMVRAGVTPPTRGGRSGLSSDAILVYTGLPEAPKPHQGMVGAKMEAEAFCRLSLGRSLLDEFKHHPMPGGFELSTSSSNQQALF